MKHTKILALVMAVLLVAAACFMTSCGKAAGYRLPIVCGEDGMNSICGVATLGVDYYNLGVKAGDMAAEILLNGKKPSELDVGGDQNPTLTVNQAVAEQIGFTIPESVKSRATQASAAKVTRAENAVVSSGADFTVGILQLVQHVALDKCNEGFIDSLSVKMAACGKTVTIDNQNASGDASNNSIIASTFVAKKVDLIYTIATSSSQAAKAAAEGKDIPVLFNAVTDPVGAGLVASLSANDANDNVTGVSDMNPVARQIDLIAELLGKDDITIGLLYTSSETNSVLQIDLAAAECEAKGYKYKKAGLGDINDLEASFRSLAKSVDAIYIPTDNLLANGAAHVHAVNLGE